MCGVCERIQKTLKGNNKYFVKELQTGYVVLGDYQRFKGYTLFLCKTHATELHQLEQPFRDLFLHEMSLAAEAAFRAFQPEKMNYELLGQGDNIHMHWHFFPRRKGDTPVPGPVWKLPKEEMYADKYLPSDSELQEMKQKLNEMHVGRLIHILSHTMKRHNPAEVMENDDLTTMQKHVLKFILLETMHRDLYQKDIEEEFQIRKPTVTGILKLMEKNGYIYRESAKQDARLKQIIPTEKAEKIRPAILKSIEEGEAKMLRGIPKEDVELCKQVLWQMYENRKKSCDSRNDF